MREKPWGGSIFYDSLPSTSPYTFQNIYVGHLHFISRKCHILTSNTLSWHLFFETLYSASSALYHLLCVSISTRFDWAIKRAIFHCIVSILSSLLLRRSFGSSPPPEPVLGTRTRDEPPRTSTWKAMKMGVRFCNIAVLDFYFTWILRVFIFCHAVIVVLWEVVSFLSQETLRIKEWQFSKRLVVQKFWKLIGPEIKYSMIQSLLKERKCSRVLAYKRLKPLSPFSFVNW